jgi:WD repeat-containing protein 7
MPLQGSNVPVSTSTLSSSGLIPSTHASAFSSPSAPTSPGSAEIALRTKLRSQAVIVLAILGCEFPEALVHPPDLVRELTAELLHLILEDNPVNRLRVTAAELLGKGFHLWGTYVGDTIALIQKLLKLTLVAEPKGLAKASKRALMLIAGKDARRFIHAIGYRFTHPESAGAKPTGPVEALGPKEHSQALSLLSRLVKRYPAEFLVELPLLIESVVRSLDPHVPLLREVSLKPATTLVHDLVMRYPMVSFDQEEQRLAVGTKDGPIFIYDLNSATRWHVLEGHKLQVSALSFNENGKMMASYSVEESCVKLWKTSQSFLGVWFLSSKSRLHFFDPPPKCRFSEVIPTVTRRIKQPALIDPSPQ